MGEEELARRWNADFQGRLSLGQELIRRYADVRRVYHGPEHLLAVLAHIDELAAEAADPLIVQLAAWFHDAVYDVRRDDNEERSAELARTVLPAYDFVPAVVDEVARLVLATRDHVVAEGDGDGEVLCDADLAILASTPAEYDDYVGQVRAEYRHVAEPTFRAARAAILQALLDRPTIFATTAGQKRWESAARANLSRELATQASGVRDAVGGGSAEGDDA